MVRNNGINPTESIDERKGEMKGRDERERMAAAAAGFTAVVRAAVEAPPPVPMLHAVASPVVFYASHLKWTACPR